MADDAYPASTASLARTTHAPPAPRFALLLSLLLGAQPVVTDLYLPALPQLSHALAAGAGRAQWTLTALMLAFGFGQLLCGPIADRFGRRTVLLAGLALYTLSGLGGAMAGSIGALVGWRILQGIATAAVIVCARAAVRDCFDAEEGARMMARGLGGLGAIALVSPVLGAAATNWFGWRGAIAMIGLFGAVTFVYVAWTFTETGRHALKQPRAPFGTLLRHPQFITCTLLAAFTYTGAFCFLLQSSFVFIEQFGVSRMAYGLVPASCSLAYVIGTQLCRKRLAHLPVVDVVRGGAWLSAAGATGQGVLWLAGAHQPWAILLPQWVYMLGHGFHQPCGQSGAVAPFPLHAAQAAALSGFLMTVMAFVAGQLLLRIGHVSVGTLMMTTCVLGWAVAITAWWGLPRGYRAGAV